jgi:hypothetical protein
MCLRRAPEKYIAGAALDRAAVKSTKIPLTASQVKVTLRLTVSESVFVVDPLWGSLLDVCYRLTVAVLSVNMCM